MNLWTLDADVDAEEDDEDQQVPLIAMSVLFNRDLSSEHPDSCNTACLTLPAKHMSVQCPITYIPLNPCYSGLFLPMRATSARLKRKAARCPWEKEDERELLVTIGDRTNVHTFLIMNTVATLDHTPLEPGMLH